MDIKEFLTGEDVDAENFFNEARVGDFLEVSKRDLKKAIDQKLNDPVEVQVVEEDPGAKKDIIVSVTVPIESGISRFQV